MRLLARNAECLFWLARYLERAACLARVIEMQSTFGAQDRDQGWNWLLTLHSNEDLFRERFEPSAETIVAFYLTDKGNSGSIRSSVHWARENARALRPFIPLEMWAQLNTFQHTIELIGADDIQRSKLPRTCAQIRAGCLAQIGVAEGLLYRDEGYQFFKLGLMIERADQTSRLLDVKYAQGPLRRSSALTSDPAHDFMFWSTILRTVGAYQVFHRLMADSPDAESVARFLVLNPSHPRSIGFCVREITDALNMLRSGFRLPGANAGLEACEILSQGLQVAAEDAQLLGRLHEFNDWVQRALMHLTAQVGAAFFKAPSPKERLEPLLTQQTVSSQTETSTQGQSQSQGQT